jgi:hypothetical protein
VASKEWITIVFVQEVGMDSKSKGRLNVELFCESISVTETVDFCPGEVEFVLLPLGELLPPTFACEAHC